MKTWLRAVGIAAIALCTGAALAQDAYPNKTVRVIVPYAAGGGTDALARLVAQRLSDKWKQPVVVENRPGAEGVIGSDAVAKSAPDGYTLLWAVQAHAINPFVRLNMPFDTQKAFVPITQVAATPYVIAVGKKLPARSMAELLAQAKANPGKISFGSSDPGARIMGELFKSGAGIDIVNVPYKGSAPILNDLLGGHIEMGFVSLPSAMTHYKAGTIALVAVSTPQRTALAAEIPTVAESGVKDFDVSIWWGLFAPAGTPREIVDKIQRDLVQIGEEGDFREAIMKAGAVPVLSTPPAFAKFVSDEMARAERVVKQVGMKAE
jgi:tripartite-type tricarboxylate transporter receptor subunit TctC